MFNAQMCDSNNNTAGYSCVSTFMNTVQIQGRRIVLRNSVNLHCYENDNFLDSEENTEGDYSDVYTY